MIKLGAADTFCHLATIVTDQDRVEMTAMMDGFHITKHSAFLGGVA